MRDSASWLMLVMVVLVLIVLAGNYEELKNIREQVQQIGHTLDK